MEATAKQIEGEQHDAVYAMLLKVEQGEVTLHEACRTLGVHRSTLWRKLNRVRSEGATGLRHRLAGRPSNRRLPDDLRAKAIALYREVVLTRGVPVAEFYRELAERHGVKASYATLTRWLRSEGLTASAPRRRHRVAGESVVLCRVEGPFPIAVFDGSTGAVFGYSNGTGYEAMKRALGMMIEREGLPMRVIVDRELLASITANDKRHFRAACDKLGVSLGTSMPRNVDMAAVTAQIGLPPAAVQGESVFVRPSDDRWRKALA